MSASNGRVKTPTRGAKRHPRPTKAKPPNMKPLRVEGVLIAAILDEKGEVVGEEPVANIKIFAPRFETLPAVVEGIWPQVVASRK